MIAILGKSGSGKSTIVNKLKSMGYKVVRPYTTRPKRSEDDTEYHFRTNDEFDAMIENGEFQEYARFKRDGKPDLCFGTLKTDYIPISVDPKRVVILNPDSLKYIIDNTYDYIEDEHNFPLQEMYIVYIHTNGAEISSRLLVRGDNHEEVINRMASDNKAFDSQILTYADYIITNNNGANTNTIARTIDKIYRDYIDKL